MKTPNDETIIGSYDERFGGWYTFRDYVSLEKYKNMTPRERHRVFIHQEYSEYVEKEFPFGSVTISEKEYYSLLEKAERLGRR